MDSRINKKVKFFFSSHKLKFYKKDSYIIKTGETPAGIFCLTKGVVRCFALSKSGEELTINIFKPLSFFPMNWVLNNRLDHYTYEAFTDIAIYVAPKEDVKRFIDENEDVAYDLLKRIYRGLEGYFLRMESFLCGEAYFKTLTQIIIHSRRFGVGEGKRYKIKLTHMQLASLAGLTRETVTREIKKLQNAELVTYEKDTLVVRDIEKLEQELFT